VDDGLTCKSKQIERGDCQCYGNSEYRCENDGLSLKSDGVTWEDSNCEWRDPQCSKQSMLSHVKSSIENVLERFLRFISKKILFYIRMVLK